MTVAGAKHMPNNLVQLSLRTGDTTVTVYLTGAECAGITDVIGWAAITHMLEVGK